MKSVEKEQNALDYGNEIKERKRNEFIPWYKMLFEKLGKKGLIAYTALSN